MDEEEIKDTIVVALWPPRKPDGNEKAAKSRTTQAQTISPPAGTSTAQRPLTTPKWAATRACGFCRPFIKPNAVCSHMRKLQKVVQGSGRSAVRVHRPKRVPGSKQKADTTAVAAAAERPKTTGD